MSFRLDRSIYSLRLLSLVAVIIVLGWFDLRTGPDIGFSLFYLMPVAAAGWFDGRSSALTLAVCAATSWFVADYLGHDIPLAITVWNTLTRLVIYAALGTLVARMRGERDRLQRANEELQAFSHSVSHDLRSPLLQIGRYAEMIENRAQGLDDDARRHLNTIARASSDGLKLIDDLLEFAQLARTDIHRSAVNLNAIAAKLQSEVSETEGQRTIRWNVSSLPVVSGDAPMLEVALRNLVNNAVKYTRPRDEAVIEIGSYSEDDGVVIYVRDNGVGFNPQYSSKLFKVFERLHGQGDFEGSGIGLALVHRIVSRHEGSVWAEGAVDGGATFYMKVPGTR